jgi:hypothetical protein
VSVRFSTIDDQPQQMEMFGEADEKRKRLADAVDALKSRRGDAAVIRAAQLEKKRH